MNDNNGGNVAEGLEAILYVPKIVTETVATSPPNRARKTIGVGEEVKLSVVPAVTTSAGDITWELDGSGILDKNSGVTNKFTAPARNATTTITASFSSGASCSTVFQTIEPSDIVFENNMTANYSGFAPPQFDFYAVCYWANVYFLPDTVNFGRMKVCESYAQTQTLPGYFQACPPKPHSSWENAPLDVVGSVVVPGRGTKAEWNPGDQIQGTSDYIHVVPISDGYAWWDIPWLFKVGNGAYKQIRIVRQDYRLIGDMTNATLRVTKGASGAEISTGETTLRFITP
jgi:hypothetical protein